LGFGVLVVGCGVWGVGCGMSGLGLRTGRGALSDRGAETLRSKSVNFWSEKVKLTRGCRDINTGVLNLRTTTSQKCEAVPRGARIQGPQTVVSRNSRLERNKEEEKTLRNLDFMI